MGHIHARIRNSLALLVALLTLASASTLPAVSPPVSWAARSWLQRWQAEHVGSIKYHPVASNATALPVSRIPRTVVVTVASARQALDSQWGENFATFWKLAPEYAFHIFEDVDCEAFLAACCSADEQLAFKLVKTGTQKSNVFLSLWLREVGGILVDQDTALVKPLSSTIPTWAAIVTTWETCFRSRAGCWMYGNLFAVEPNTPIWHYTAKEVVHAVLVQSHYACQKSFKGCRGFFGCVQELTGPGPYARALSKFLKNYNCQPPVYECSETTTGYCIYRGQNLCPYATHKSLLNLMVWPESDSPTRHVPCHSKVGKVQSKRCERPKESEVHYVSKPEGAYNYYHATGVGKRDGSSAPGYFKPHCSDKPDTLLASWTECLQARAQSPPWQSRYNTMRQKDRMAKACPADAKMYTYVMNKGRRGTLRNATAMVMAPATAATT